MKEVLYSLVVSTSLYIAMSLLGIQDEFQITGMYIACWLGTEYKRIARVVSNAFFLR